MSFHFCILVLPLGVIISAGEQLPNALMNYFNNYDEILNEIGLTEVEDREVVLGFVQELFSIAIEHIDNEELVMEEAL